MIPIYTSYFYQIRNFTPNLIPVSTAISDPAWYRPPEGKEYYIDKRGVICGLKYKPLIVQLHGSCGCPCDSPNLAPNCPTMKEYRQLLETLDFDRVMKALEYCGENFAPSVKKDITDPIIVLMVYEPPQKLCSERFALQDYFTSHGVECKELEYPIRKI